jgi:hypothetical protein
MNYVSIKKIITFLSNLQVAGYANVWTSCSESSALSTELFDLYC